MQSSMLERSHCNISLKDVTRKTLLNEVRAGNQLKITEFYYGYKNVIRYFVKCITAKKNWFIDDEDLANVIQDVLASILKGNTLAYDSHKGAKFRTWLRRVVEHKLINLIRAKCSSPNTVPFDENKLSQETYYSSFNPTGDEVEIVEDLSSGKNEATEIEPNETLDNVLDGTENHESLKQDTTGRSVKRVIQSPKACDKEDPALIKEWDEEWRRTIIKKALEQLKQEKDPDHYRAFYLLVVEGMPAEIVAEETKLEINNLYAIRSRCAQRMKVIIRQMEKLW